MQAETTGAGHEDCLVVKRVVWLWNANVGPAGSGIELRRTMHVECFMGPFAVQFLQEGVKVPLLLQDVGARRASGFFLQRQIHALMAAVLLWMTGADAFDANAQAQPPHGELRKLE